MNKLWLVGRYEYLKAVRRRTFLLTTLGLPVLIVAIVAFFAATATRTGVEGAVGYVDLAGFVTNPPVVATTTTAVSTSGGGGDATSAAAATAAASSAIAFVPYKTQPAAEAALKAGEIQAFYVIPSDYVSTGNVSLYFMTRAPSERVKSAFSDLLARQLVVGLNQQTQERVLGGPARVEAQELGKPVEAGGNGVVRFLLPMVIGFLFVLAVMASSGYLLQAVADEKENRTIEIMTTSMSSDQLIVGKSLGLIAVGLTQVLVWVIVGVGAAVILGGYVEQLRSLQIPWTFLGLTVLFFFPAFVFEAGVITAIGAAVSDLRQGQQLSGILQLFFFLPLFFLANEPLRGAL